MTAEEDSGTELSPEASAFMAELIRWRELSGMSQKKLAETISFDRSYVSKAENGGLVPSREFVEAADSVLEAGRSLIRRWKTMVDALGVKSATHAPAASAAPAAAPEPQLLVEHEHAELVEIDGMFRTRIRRQIRNTGTQPVTQYLIRIAVDRFPGDPDRSNQLYRQAPLTWEELRLEAHVAGEPMIWRAKHDHDAFKEIWLLFENADGRFPLYPDQTVWLEYTYTVAAEKWGPWWQRAIRLPTCRLSMSLDLPADRDPAVWGLETSMTADASPVRTPITRTDRDGRAVFTWSTEDPPLHARYRLEWKFKANETSEERAQVRPSEQMADLGIAQEGDPVLAEPATPFDLPAEAEDARRVIAQLVSTMERVGQVHDFAKGMGLAAPQIHIGRCAALVRTADGEMITLLNPRVIDQAGGTDDQYEGCLSFFDVRGMVPRPLAIEVEHQEVDGSIRITCFEQGEARLVAHEIDHLNGTLYRSRMRPGIEPIPVSQYRGAGQQWTYPKSE